MIDSIYYVLEDIHEPGMCMAAPTDSGFLMFGTITEAEEYLWSRDCLVTMGYRVTLLVESQGQFQVNRAQSVHEQIMRDLKRAQDGKSNDHDAF